MTRRLLTINDASIRDSILVRVPLWLKIELAIVERRFPRRLVFTIDFRNESPAREAVLFDPAYGIPSNSWRIRDSTGKVVEPNVKNVMLVSYAGVPPHECVSIEPYHRWRRRKWGRLANDSLSINYGIRGTCCWQLVRGETYRIEHRYDVGSNECVWTYQ